MADSAALAELTLLVEAQARGREQLTATGVAAARHAALTFNEWYSPKAIGKWASGLLDQERAVQRQLASLTDAYLARAATLIKGKPVRPAGAVDVTTLRGGDVNMLHVYGRAADQYRYAISQGQAEAEATNVAVERITTIVSDDADLVMRAQSQHSMQTRGITGYRRVIHPELSRGGSCGLCVAASTRIYRTNELMPMHANCHCLPVEIVGDKDFGGAINDEALAQLYEHARLPGAVGPDNTMKSLKRTRYVVEQHGELGPVLRIRGQHFRTYADIPLR